MGSVVLGVGAFIYDKMQSASLETVRQQLTAEKNRFQFDILDDIRAIDNRLKSAQALIDGHVSPSKLFDILERSTQEDVQYTAMAFVRRPSGDISVLLTGITTSFNSVALQAQRFGEESTLRDGSAIFTDLNKESDGDVIFTVTLDIPKEALVFEGTLTEETTEEDTDAEFDVEADFSQTTAEEEVVPEDNALIP